jgi:hypothetical protein
MRPFVHVALALSVFFPMLCMGADLSLTADGEIACDLSRPSLALNTMVSVIYQDRNWEASGSLCLETTGSCSLAFTALASEDISGIPCTLVLAAGLDGATAELASASLGLSASLKGAEMTVNLIGNGQGTGIAAQLDGEEGGVLELLSVGFNIDEYGRVQTGSCALCFTFAEVEMRLPLGCTDIDLSFSFDASGLKETVLSVSKLGGLPVGVQFGATVHLDPIGQTVDVIPSLVLRSGTCFEIYAGLAWDEPTRTLGGSSVYGIGLSCAAGDIELRGLWELDPSSIELVKTPYWALIGLVWDLPSVLSEPGEGSVALFFGEEALFALGEIEFAAVWSIAPGWSAGIQIDLKVGGGGQFVFRWEGEL